MQGLVDVFEGHSKSSKNIQSVADMLNFVENFSEFSAAQRNAGKPRHAHVRDVPPCGPAIPHAGVASGPDGEIVNI